MYKYYTCNLAEIFPLCIFEEGHRILQNLHQLFDWKYIGQMIGGDFAKFCGLLRIYEAKMMSMIEVLLTVQFS